METNTLTEGMIKYFENPKDSKITNEEGRLDTINLCSTIEMLCFDASGYIEDAGKEKNAESREYFFNRAMEMTFQIGTIARIIKERMCCDDFDELDNLIYEYEQMTKE